MIRGLFELAGYVLRRRGQSEEGLRNLERAVEAWDPRNILTLQQIAGSLPIHGPLCRAIAALASRVSDPCQTTPTLASSGRISILLESRHCDSSEMNSSGRPWARNTNQQQLIKRWFEGDNDCWGEGMNKLSRSFGEGCWRGYQMMKQSAHGL
jgi:hypothetical protein